MIRAEDGTGKLPEGTDTAARELIEHLHLARTVAIGYQN